MKQLLFLLMTIIVSHLSYAQVGIGTKKPDNSAMLEIKSEDKGILIPRMSTAQRTSILNPATGLLVFDSETGSFWFKDAAGWKELAAGGESGLWKLNGNDMVNTNTGHLKFQNNNKPFISFYNYGGLGFSGSAPSIFLSEEEKDFEITAGVLDAGHQGTPGNLLLQTDVTIDYINEDGYPDVATFSYAGNVGIGTKKPTEKLTVSEPGFGITHTDGSTKLSTYVRDGYGWLTTQTNSPLAFATQLLNGNNVAQMILFQNGNVAIGTFNQNYKLSVNGTIRSKEVIVQSGWADYVFDRDYLLKPLPQVESFIQKNKHLPGIPSAKEIEQNGLPVGEIQKRMMEKIEELTLYIIDLNKQIEDLRQKIH